jgi:hypothetical protein
VHLLSFIKALAGCCLDDIVKQVRGAVGQQVECVLLAGGSFPPSGPTMQLSTWPCNGSSNPILEARVMQHVRNCRAAYQRGPMHFSWRSANSRVGNVGLQNGIGCLPTYVAFAMSPQACCSQKCVGDGKFVV